MVVTMCKLHMDVDAGMETMEQLIPRARLQGGTCDIFVCNRDITESTCNVYGDLDLELRSQEIAFMLDGTWGKHYLQEEGV
jgi:hypothetical protein